MQRYLMIPIVYGLLLAGLLSGCGGGGGGATATAVPTGEVLLQIALPAPDALPVTRSIGEIAAFRVTVSGAGAPQVMTIPWTPPTPVSQRMTVRAGDNVILAVAALDDAAVIHYHGQTTVDIAAGAVTPVTVTLSPTLADVALDTTLHTGEPGLTIDEVPPVGTGGSARGTVTGRLDPETLAVAVYIKVGGGWWSKPYFDAPLTFPRAEDGHWQCDIITGGSDAAATHVAAFLVYRTAAVPLAGGGALPDIAHALASVQVARPSPGE
ncbi:MAG TPA: hypothetical protein PLZ36_06990 [Armatimonadota bacterium]|nr:hypothetical protein [Armatimonadota bacterium]HOS43829.1 hypothetical protein [Armatimonadota bacterium]